MNIKLPNKKKRNVIFLSILAFLFFVSGSFLLWRVNQESRLDPLEGEAGSVGSCCCPKGENCGGACPSYTICPTGTECNKHSSCSHLNAECGVCQYVQQGCYWGHQFPSGVVDDKNACYCSVNQTWKKSDSCKCAGNCAGEVPRDCTKSKVCEFPKNAFLGPGMTSCTCMNWWEQKAAANSISGSYCTSAPPVCSISKTCAQYDMLDCGISGDGKSKSGCTRMSDASCKSYCPGCQNMSVFYLYCKSKPVVPTPNVCDGGNWESKPSGTYLYCDEILYSFVAKDSDGINKSSINVKVNGDARVNASQISLKTGDTEVRVTETLSTEENCLDPGEYTIETNWTDKKGATSTQCALTTSFTVLEEVENPNWDITKTVIESCIDENTDDPKSKLDYIVTVRNQGEGAGQITSVEDILDNKVLEGYMVNISSKGEFHNGFIIWALTEADREFAPGQSKSYTYSYIVPSNAFGLYENTVTAFPLEGSPLIANASITADCVISEFPEEEVVPESPTVPETGIFDNSQTAILIGLGLLVLGFSWTGIGRRVFVLSKGIISKTKITVRDVREGERLKKDINRKKNFEKKVVKD